MFALLRVFSSSSAYAVGVSTLLIGFRVFTCFKATRWKELVWCISREFPNQRKSEALNFKYRGMYSFLI